MPQTVHSRDSLDYKPLPTSAYTSQIPIMPPPQHYTLTARLQRKSSPLRFGIPSQRIQIDSNAGSAMGARSSLSVLSVIHIVSFDQLAYCVHTRSPSRSLDKLSVCQLHWRSPPRRTRIPSRGVCSISSSPGSPPRAHTHASVCPCRSIGSGDACYRARKCR